MTDTLQQVRHDEPVAPRRLQSSLPPDLETICLKCLEKVPAKRYSGADALAEDLGRFLAGLPISARPISPLERTARWCWRNPRVAGLMATLIVVLVSGFASVTILWRLAAFRGEQARSEHHNASQQRRRAEQKFQFARRAVDDMYTKVAERWLASEAGMTELQREFLEKAVAFYDEFVLEEGDDPQVRFKTAQAYHFLARVQSRLGRITEAEHAFRQQARILEQLIEQFPGESKYRFDLFHNHLALMGQVGTVEFERMSQKALLLIRRLSEDFPDEPLFQDALAHQLGRIGGAKMRAGQVGEAAEHHREGLRLARDLVARFPDRTEKPAFISNVEQNLMGLGHIHVHRGEFDQAERAFRECVLITEELARRFPDERVHQQARVVNRIILGELLSETGRWSEAREVLAVALREQEQLCQDFPEVPGYRAALANAHWHTGVCLHALRSDECIQSLRTSIEIYDVLVRDFPELGLDSALAWILATSPVIELRDTSRAIRLAQQAVDRDSDNREWRAILAVALYRGGKWQECVELLATADTTSRAAFTLAMSYWQLGRPEEARAAYARAVALANQTKRPDFQTRDLHAEAAEMFEQSEPR